MESGTFGLNGAGQIADASDLIIAGGSTFAMGTHSETIDQLVLLDGNVTGTLAATLTGTSPFDVRNGTISARLAGNVGLAKTTAGTVTLSGLNAYTGITSISGGVLSINIDINLGAIPGSVTADHLIIDGGTLRATDSFTLSNNRGIALGPGSGASGGTIEVIGSHVLTYGGVLADNGASGSLTKIGSGTLLLSGANTYSGDTTISAGVIQMGERRHSERCRLRQRLHRRGRGPRSQRH